MIRFLVPSKIAFNSFKKSILLPGALLTFTLR